MSGLEMKYFVLKPKGKDLYAEASRQAIWIYAKTIEPENPVLADNLRDWVQCEIEENQPNKATSNH